MLLKLGIPTYSDTYYTALKGSTPTKIGQVMPSVIGLIYGLSVDVGGCLPQSSTALMLRYDQAYLVFLQLKMGAALYVDNYRVDRLVYNNTANTTSTAVFTNQQRYFPVVVPAVTDLKESTYYNPAGLGSSTTPVYVPLTVHYIDVDAYKYLKEKGYVFPNANSAPPTAHAPK